MFDQDWSFLRDVKLHLPASEFQIRVWQALLKIPMGHVTSYGDIAKHIGQPLAHERSAWQLPTIQWPFLSLATG